MKAYTIQLRRDTAENWVRTNPVLGSGEVGLVLSGLPKRAVAQKIGDGVTRWNDLPYYSTGEAVPADPVPGEAYLGRILTGRWDGSSWDDVTLATLDSLLADGVSRNQVIIVDLGAVSSSGLLTMPALSVRPVLLLPSVTGSATGAFSMPAITVQPTVVTPTGLVATAAGSGSLVMPSITVQPALSVPSLVGAQVGSIVIPVVSIQPALVVPSVAGVLVSAPTTPVITVTPGDGSNVISLSSGGTGATSYDIHWGTVSGTRSNTITGVTLPYTHTGRTNGTTYYYSLVAINAGGSTESAEVSGTPAATGSVYDSYNRANNSTLGTGWQGQTGVAGRFTVTSNRAQANAEASDQRTDSLNADQYAEALVVTVPGFGAKGVGVYVRGSASAKTFYAALADFYDDGQGGFQSYVGLYKCVAGTWSQLGTIWDRDTTAWDTSLTVRLEVVGSSLTVKTAATHGGTYTTRITATDAAIASGAVGIYSEQATGVLDDFYGGNM